MADPCPHCGHNVAQHLDRCEHCGRDVGAPNVRAAKDPAEVAALEWRFAAALEEAERRGCRPVVDRFMETTAKSKAVICKTRDQLHGIVATSFGSWLIPTYYQQVEGQARAPDGPQWDWTRSQERRWFPNYTDRIHYGALSLTDSGVAAWG